MKNNPSYHLTPSEWEVIQDKEFLPRKFIVCQKMEGMLGELKKNIEAIGPFYAARSNKEKLTTHSKISKGDNYKYFPYRVLDCPMVNEGGDFFSFRTVFLWGQSFGFHLIMTGKFKEAYQATIIEQRRDFPIGFHLSNQATPWIWEMDEKNLEPLRELSLTEASEIIQGKDFIRVSSFFPLEHYADVPEKGVEIWRFWRGLL